MHLSNDEQVIVKKSSCGLLCKGVTRSTTTSCCNGSLESWGGHKVAISRAFTGQFQRGCAIQENHGDDNFLSHKQGLSFCVRKMFVANQDST